MLSNAQVIWPNQGISYLKYPVYQAIGMRKNEKMNSLTSDSLIITLRGDCLFGKG